MMSVHLIDLMERLYMVLDDVVDPLQSLGWVGVCGLDNGALGR